LFSALGFGLGGGEFRGEFPNSSKSPKPSSPLPGLVVAQVGAPSVAEVGAPCVAEVGAPSVAEVGAPLKAS